MTTHSQDKPNDVEMVEEHDDHYLEKTETSGTVVKGSTQLYSGGRMRLIPMPTADPAGMYFPSTYLWFSGQILNWDYASIRARNPNYPTGAHIILQTLSIYQHGESS